MMGRRFDGNLALFLSVLNSFRKLRFYIYIYIYIKGSNERHMLYASSVRFRYLLEIE